MRVSYAIVFVSDMKRSVAFYRDVIGLPLKFDSPEWSEFATEGATLALHRSEHAPAAPDESDLPAGRCRPGLSVPTSMPFTCGWSSTTSSARSSRRICSAPRSRSISIPMGLRSRSAKNDDEV